jgi:CheY-like chemotaxis protein/signal transduction histidine kinase/CHASE3 domain sensor protein
MANQTENLRAEAGRLPRSTSAGLATALLAVILIGALAWRSLEQVSEANFWVTHTQEVLQVTFNLLNVVTDAETSNRTYLLTHDETYLKGYDDGIVVVPTEIAHFRQLTLDNKPQTERADRLQALIDKRFTQLHNTINLAKAGKWDESRETVLTGFGRETMRQIRQLVKEMQDDERALLVIRQAAFQKTSSVSTTISLGGAAFLFILLLVAIVLVRRDFLSRGMEAWLRTGENGFVGKLPGEQNTQVLAHSALDYLGDYLGAAVGAAYVAEPDGTLVRKATYAFTPAPADRDTFKPREGFVGQAAAEKRMLHVSDVPRDYVRASSGLGEHPVRELLVIPAMVDNQVTAVLELGFFRGVQKPDRDLAEITGEPLSIALRTAQYRARLEALLEETQRQSEELQTQQEELRVSNEELEEQSRALRESQARLEMQQSDLAQSNAQLELQKAQVETAQKVLSNKNAELMSANQYKSEFLANMSHELRTPLNSSLILAKLLSENRTGNLTEEQIKFAETIYGAGNDLLNLINDILDLSKIEAGKMEVRAERIGMHGLADNLRKQFQPVADQKRLRFVNTVEGSAPPDMETDGQRMQQILKNLLSNAFKFTDAGEVSFRVTGASTAESEQVFFEVKDSGIGIAAENQDLVFDAFKQVEGTSSRKYGGTGLGLSISRDLARLLGGDITLTSAPGKGSIFTLTLPRKYVPATAEERAQQAKPRSAPPPPERPARAEQALAAMQAMVPQHSSDNSRRILLVEDDPGFAEAVVAIARELEFDCLVATTADAGFELALREQPSGIVLDVRLPDHSGLSVLDRLKRNAKTRHIPVHVVSGADYTQAALEMGAVGYGLKPIARDDLTSALRALVTKSEQKGRRVLIVEDDAVQRDSLGKLLASEGVQIVVAGTAAEAQGLLRQTTFDCMVLDLSLPDQSGYQLLETMAKDEELAFPPVIVYTGRSLDRDEEEKLRRFSRSIIIKGARSPERLLDEVTLFLHQVETKMPPERQRMLKEARDRETLFEGRRILLVEDDVRNIFALSRVLEPKGAQVEIARNGLEALDHLAKKPGVDLVLMDIMMPEMDGFTAMREIRKNAEWTRLPIIALTAKAMRDDQEKCMEAGANDYVAKPIDVDKLLSLLRVWLPR